MHSNKLVLPKEATDTHKCFLCGHVLSVPPITLLSADAEQYRCGRCKLVDSKTYTRNTLFENVAQFLSLPCTYKDCNQKIPWGLVEDHEKVCPYRTIRCPLYYQQCDDEVVVSDIYSHFREKHKTNIKTFGQDWNVNVGFDYVYLIRVVELNFLVYILHLNNTFSMGVFALEPLKKHLKYSVKLSSIGEEEFFVAYENQNIESYEERRHCYKCIRKLCLLKHHPYSKDNKKTEMQVDQFTKKFNKDLITMISGSKGDIKYTVTLPSQSEKPGQKNETSEDPNSNVNETHKTQLAEQSKNDLFRKSFECPICEEYLVGPIYTCSTGHTICNVCRPRLKQCPVCQTELGNSRNYSLELMVENVELHCQYHNNGCTFTGITEKLYKHELNCSHKQ